MLRIFLYLVLIHSVISLNIFEDSISTCKYSIKKQSIGKKKKILQEKIVLSSEVFTLSNNEVEVTMNICGNLEKRYCGNDAAACIKYNGEEKVNAGQSFEPLIVDGLESVNGFKCTADAKRNYTIFVNFDKNENAMQPSIQDSDECSVTVMVPHPNLNPYCTVKNNGLLLNLRVLQKMAKLESPDKSFNIKLCKKSPNETQVLRYDEKTSVLSIKSRYMESKYSKIDTAVILKCNWNLDMGPLNRTLKQRTFSVETKYGCIKFPMQCLFEDDEHFVYDMRSLNKTEGWKVQNITNGELLINVCGKLKTDQKNPCLYSQVCHKKGGGNIESYGSRYTTFQFEDDNAYITLFDGSPCMNKNESTSYSTKVLFKCSEIENGPIFTKKENCTNFIEWKTSKACPFNVTDVSYEKTRLIEESKYKIFNCIYKNGSTLYDISNLMSNNKNYEIYSNNLHYIINICRPIIINSDTYLCRLSGTCIKNTTEVNIKNMYIPYPSFLHATVEDTKLTLHYRGGLCNNSLLRQVDINLYCSHTESPLKLVSETMCLTVFEWRTKYACPTITSGKQKRSLCHIRSSEGKEIFSMFNLSKPNFQYFDNNNNITYSFNICESNFFKIIGDTSYKFLFKSVELKENNTQLYLQYHIKDDCESGDLNTLLLYLKCGQNDENYDLIKRDGCLLSMNFWTKDLCQFVNYTFNEESLKVENKIGIDNELASENKIEMNKESENLFENCELNGENGLTFKLLNIGHFQQNTQSNNYSIGYSKQFLECNGFICKNKMVIVSLNDICPNMEIDGIESEIKITFEHEIEKNVKFVTHLYLKCKEDGTEVTVLEESTNNLKIKLHVKEVCNLLKHISIQPPEKSSNVGSVIGYVTLVVVMIISSIFIFKYYRRTRYSSLSGSRKSLTKIYLKDAEL